LHWKKFFVSDLVTWSHQVTNAPAKLENIRGALQYSYTAPQYKVTPSASTHAGSSSERAR
jgi:hypothetical protein